MTDHRTGLFRNGTGWCTKESLERIRRGAEGGEDGAKADYIRAQMRCGVFPFDGKDGAALGQAMIKVLNGDGVRPQIDAQSEALRGGTKKFIHRDIVPAIKAVSLRVPEYEVFIRDRKAPWSSWADEYRFPRQVGYTEVVVWAMETPPAMAWKDLENIKRYIERIVIKEADQKYIYIFVDQHKNELRFEN